MTRVSTWLAALLIASALARPARADDDGPVRVSLPTASDREAWQRPGFRLQLGVLYGHLFGIGGAPGGPLVGPLLRIGLRLDPDWSLLASFSYAVASGDLSGLRYGATLEPTWHLTPHLGVALGLGLAGIVEGRTGRADPEPLPGTLDTSYTFPDASPPIARCIGAGVVGLTRADWLWVLGPRTSTGLALELDGQWTGCVDDTGRVEPDTARPIVRRQFWPHLGVSLSWVIAWR